MRVMIASTAVAAALIGAGAAGAAHASEDAYCFDKGSLRYVPCEPTRAEPVPAPRPQAAYIDWTGLYLGLHVGYADTDFSGRFDADGAPNETLVFSNLKPSDIAYGGQFGYDHQFGQSYVFGVEFDGAFVDADDAISSSGADDQSADATINAFGSARLRGGLALEQFLPYLTAGVGVVDYEASVTDATDGDAESFQDTLIAPVFGGGLEMKILRNVSVRAEALYYAIDQSESLSDLTDGDGGDEIVVDDLWTVRGAINYRF